MTSLLEALALWADSPVRVVLCANATACTYWLGLTDAKGRGARSVFYEVEVVSPQDKRQAAQVHAFGDFEDLQQLSMELAPDGAVQISSDRLPPESSRQWPSSHASSSSRFVGAGYGAEEPGFGAEPAGGSA